MNESEPEPELEPELGPELGQIDTRTAIAFTHGHRMMGIIESLGLSKGWRNDQMAVPEIGRKNKVKFQNCALLKLELGIHNKVIVPLVCEVVYWGPYGNEPQITDQLRESEAKLFNTHHQSEIYKYNNDSSHYKSLPKPISYIPTTKDDARGILIDLWERAVFFSSGYNINTLLDEWSGVESELIAIHKGLYKPYTVYLVRHGHASHSQEPMTTKMGRWAGITGFMSRGFEFIER